MASTRCSSLKRKGFTCGVLAIALAIVSAASFSANHSGSQEDKTVVDVTKPEAREERVSRDEGETRPVDGSWEEEAGNVRDDLGILGDMEGESWEWSGTAQDVPQAATEVLKRYQRARDCLLRYAGYLDAFGNVWGCVVEGAGWVDICVVGQDLQGQGSSVGTLRLDAKDWGEAYG